MEFFEAIGFEEVSNVETSVTPGYWKIAIYARDDFPLHVARQLSNGRWTSKLGLKVDINHENLSCLEGGDLGYVAKIMRRLKTGSIPALPPLIPERPLVILP